MIVKMKFINISGPRNDIDRVTDQYLSRYEIQLESALSALKTVEHLRPFVEINPVTFQMRIRSLPIHLSVWTICLNLCEMQVQIMKICNRKRKNAKIRLNSSVQSNRSLHRSAHWNVICIRYSATGSSLTASDGLQ